MSVWEVFAAQRPLSLLYRCSLNLIYKHPLDFRSSSDVLDWNFIRLMILAYFTFVGAFVGMLVGMANLPLLLCDPRGAKRIIHVDDY